MIQVMNLRLSLNWDHFCSKQILQNLGGYLWLLVLWKRIRFWVLREGSFTTRHLRLYQNSCSLLDTSYHEHQAIKKNKQLKQKFDTIQILMATNGLGWDKARRIERQSDREKGTERERERERERTCCCFWQELHWDFNISIRLTFLA